MSHAENDKMTGAPGTTYEHNRVLPWQTQPCFGHVWGKAARKNTCLELQYLQL